jgi:hypothetical protein
LSSSEVSGSILRSTSENLTLALTHEASGAAAREAFAITESSKLDGVAEISLETLDLSWGVTVRASKLII